MKLKKLAAGACALALGVSMMAMPAFADATFGEAGGSDTRDLYATFNTTDAYCIDIVFSGGSMVYTRTWKLLQKSLIMLRPLPPILKLMLLIVPASPSTTVLPTLLKMVSSVR